MTRNRSHVATCRFCNIRRADGFLELFKAPLSKHRTLRIQNTSSYPLDPDVVRKFFSRIAPVRSHAFSNGVCYIEFKTEKDALLALQLWNASPVFKEVLVEIHSEEQSQDATSEEACEFLNTVLNNTHAAPIPVLAEYPQPFDVACGSYVLDPVSGLYFSPESGYYYNPMTKLYYSCMRQTYFKYVNNEFILADELLDAWKSPTNESVEEKAVLFSLKRILRKKSISTSLTVPSIPPKIKTRNEKKFNTWKRVPVKFACMICLRKFETNSKLQRHVKLSKLHASNLESGNNTSCYTDRAEQRRDEKQVDPQVVVVESKGSLLLKAMGWSEGHGLGKNESGIVASIDPFALGARANTKMKQGLGASNADKKKQRNII